MLFLQPAASKHRFITGLSTAAGMWPGATATYAPVKKNGHPTTDRAGIAFPGNDWITFPLGDEYLANLGEVSTQLLSALAQLRATHLAAVDDLVAAIAGGTVSQYLSTPVRVPLID